MPNQVFPTDEEETSEGYGTEETGLDDPSANFNANLALTMEARELDSIGRDLCELIEQDIEDRERRDKQYKEALQRTGMDMDSQTPGGAEFEGASKVVHPMLSTSCVEFAARAIKELFPPSGPVKTTLVGDVTQLPNPMGVGAMAPGVDQNGMSAPAGSGLPSGPILPGAMAQPLPYDQKLQQAEQKRDFLNWQLMDGIPEYRSELEQLLTQLPLGGSQYLKIYYDPSYARIRVEFVPIDEFILPYSASNLLTALRATHIQRITEEVFESRVKSGLYADTDIGSTSNTPPERTQAGKQSERIEGKSSSDNEDGLREVFECHACLELEDGLKPYIVALDRDSKEVLAIYRNWDVNDPTFQRIEWFVEFVFIPWRGAVGVGLPHLIGGLSTAATGALRALLDAAMIANFPAAVKLKSPRGTGGNIQLNATGISELDAPAGVDDVRKAIMGLPFNQPSPVLFQLLEWLTERANNVVATTAEKLEQVGDRTPVGTTQALIEQNAATYSAIHSRLHFSQYRALQIICRLNAVYSTEQDQVKALGGVLFPQAAFNTTKDIAPVSDPNIFSDAQRFAQNQAVLQLAQQTPNLPWNMLEVSRNALRTLKVPNVDSILPLPTQPFTNDDPCQEHPPALQGQPLTTMPQQNHMRHIQEHLQFLLNPVFGAVSAATAPSPGWQVILAHAQKHLMDLYSQMKQQAQQMAMQQYQQMLFQQQMMAMQQARAASGLGGMMAANAQQIPEGAQ